MYTRIDNILREMQLKVRKLIIWQVQNLRRREYIFVLNAHVSGHFIKMNKSQ
jgi:hypothetical protein